MKILILNGPNLNLLGKRSPKIYGSMSMESLLIDIQQTWPDVFFHYEQTNHEGVLIDLLQQAVEINRVDGVIINPGGYGHTSVALRDAVEYVVEQAIPVVEVHISNILEREAFRHQSLLSDVCSYTIIGHGVNGYKEAVAHILTKH